ncbi:efflux RND transporter periplasmic adaptor subunit [Novosphingobium sp.]|uniref:efflux RND transporter periplasmic adaptor subunit n=1 Tax=Novosphingobium sp. TaxID=1874826 RepID=UPI003342B8F3
MNRSASALALMLILSACGKGEDKVAGKPAGDPLQVTAPAALVARLKIAPVTMTPVSETLRVAGQIDFDENRVARIGATVTGRVAAMQANVGQGVSRGSVLAQITSTELSSQQLVYVRARSSNDLNRRNVERARTLFAAGVISAAELQRRESEYQVSGAEMRAAADQLRLLGLSGAALGQLGARGTLHSVSQVSSTMAGVVVERHLAVGQVVQPSDQLFVVADLSKVWAVAQVPEQQARFVHTGQMVTLDIPALGDEKRSGRLVYVGQVVDPRTRTVLVRTELDNAGGQLKPSMLATMLVQSDATDRLTIPASAVVRENNADHVFVAQGSNRYTLRAVSVGEESKGRRPVLSGLAAGDQVVAEGAFHLNIERNRQAIEGQ